MRQTIRRGVVCALLALPLLATPAVAAGTATQYRAAIQSLVRAADTHRSVSHYFASGALLRADGREMRGTQAISRWWQMQFTAGLRLSLRSSIVVQRDHATAVVRRATRGEACRSGCVEQARWQLSGAHITSMTLKRMPSPGVSGPPRTVPHPPSAPPRTTPTIPS